MRNNRNNRNRPSVLDTHDTFVAAVPWGNSRTVLVHLRIHGGRSYVRLRTWNRHLTKNVWYPSKRSFIIPEENAEELSDVIFSATCDESMPKPAWLIAREEAEEEAMQRLSELDVPAETVERARKELAQARRRRI